MLPISLTMSAFGPFAGEARIDFTDLKKAGLYLITGDTGAGKTTIFDGMTFALYGVASGEDRQGSMLRSDFADPGTETYVELVFSHRGKEYTIRRIPQYERPRKKGTGTTTQQAAAELWVADGADKRVLSSKTSEATEKVTEILGLDANQFRQLVMIAQGDFRRLLTAKSDERAEILRKLFGTDYIKRFQQSLRERSNESNRHYQETLRELVNQAGQLGFDARTKGESLQQEIREQEAVYKVRDIFPEVEQQLSEDQRRLANAEKEMKERAGELSQLDGQIALARDAEKLERQIQDARSRVAELTDRQKKLKAGWDEVLQKEPQRKKLQQQLAALQGELPRYQRLTQRQQEQAQAQRELKEATGQRTQAEQKLSQLQQELEAINTQLAGMEGLEARGVELEWRLKETVELGKKLKELQSGMEERNELLNQLEKLREEYERADAEYKKRNALAEEAQDLFFANQAGLLAQELAEGRPCPVCGATHHPVLARMAKDAPTEDVVKQLLKERDAAQEKRADCSQRRAEKKATAKAKREAVESQLRRDFPDFPTENRLPLINEKMEATEKEYRGLQKEQKALGKQLELQKELQRQLAEGQQRLTAQQAALEQSSLRVQQANIRLQSAVQALEEIRAGLTYPSESAARTQATTLERKCAGLEQEKTDAQNRLQDCSQRLKQEQGSLNTLQGQKKSAPSRSVSALNAEREALVERQEKLNLNQLGFHKRIDQNRMGKEKLEQLWERMEAQDREYQFLSSLANVANGTMSGTDKLAFEQYVQATYFDRILHAANRRFEDLSSGQFRLVRSTTAADARSQTGLDLNVLDKYTGKERSVKTLSGGESFLASMSLALGLSDVVQAANGGIRMDAMFIDEGFGSLDENVLNQAIQVLNQLAGNNRMVGIISHVAELQENIPTQIQVEKTQTGSSLKIVTD